MTSPATPTPSRWSKLIGDVTRPPERSLQVRVAVLAALLMAVVSAAVAGAVGAPIATLSALAMIGGTAVAHWRREDTTPWLALGITLATLVLVAVFVSGKRDIATPAELREPLAGLLILMEGIRAAGMRTRRDLRFALSSSAAIVAVGASLSISMSLLLPLAGWAIASAVALAAAHRADLLERADPLIAARPRAARSLKPALVAIASAAVVAAAVFLIVPAAQSSRFLASLSRLPNTTPVPQQGGLSNPSLGRDNPSNGGGGSDTGGDATSFGYFGFTNTLDTGVRGRPDDTLVMRVRASTPDFWRGQSFDVWDGRSWSISDESTEVLNGRGSILVPPTADQPPTRSSELIQTYFLETSGPNVIFGANRPTQVYIPQSSLFQLGEGTLRTGVELDAGAIYTVISQRPFVTEARLRAIGDTAALAPDEVRARFGVEDNVPPRVAELAAQLTAGLPSTYDKVRAIEEWLGQNTRYSLDVPPLPQGVDAVEQYLFEDRIGFCEQIATSLVVMLRSQGIPARLAVGYTPGERNPFTGLFEVKASDAHAWAEVYFPTIGWQAFDPTAQVPLSGDPPADAARVGLATYLQSKLGPHMRLIVSVAAGLGVALLVALLWRPVSAAFARRRRRREQATWASQTLQRIERLGEELGRPREPSETAREYTEALQRTVLRDDRLTHVRRMIERDAFSPQTIDPDDRAEVDRLVAAVAEDAASVPR